MHINSSCKQAATITKCIGSVLGHVDLQSAVGGINEVSSPDHLNVARNEIIGVAESLKTVVSGAGESEEMKGFAGELLQLCSLISQGVRDR